MTTQPILYVWSGTTMAPDPRYLALCHKQFAAGEEYTMVVAEPRSQAGHNHYFAAVQGAWENLPESQSTRFPSSEHLRKWCLIKAGFTDERIVVCDSERDAKNLAALARNLDGYCVIVISKNIVKVYTAKSQSVRAMGKDEFRVSKQAVLDVCASLLEVSRMEVESMLA